MKQQRRNFLKKLGLTGAAATLSPLAFASADKDPKTYISSIKNLSEDKPIRLALIGAGIMGTEDTNSALKHKNVELVAVCDLYQGRLDSAKSKWGDNLFTTKDHKELLKKRGY